MQQVFVCLFLFFYKVNLEKSSLTKHSSCVTAMLSNDNTAVPRQKEPSDIGSLVSLPTIPLHNNGWIAREVKSSVQVTCIESQSIVVKDKQTIIILSLCL